jgi:hypothetical protein
MSRQEVDRIRVEGDGSKLVHGNTSYDHSVQFNDSVGSVHFFSRGTFSPNHTVPVSTPEINRGIYIYKLVVSPKSL